MSIFQAMYTSISGMNAQANMLSSIANNIANSNTVGYKETTQQFETYVNGGNLTGLYQSGSVQTITRNNISQQGELTGTNSPTDLAINGNGFFVVSSPFTGNVLTRAGNFVQDASNNLVNAAGFTLMGYKITPGQNTNTSSGLNGLVPININTNALQAVPSTAGTLTVNLPATATAVTSNLPSANGTSPTYTDKSSITAYDNLGGAVPLDVYYTKTGNGTWEVSVYNGNDAASGGGFPYKSGPLTTQTLNFDPSKGSLTSPTSLGIPIPNGNTISIDISKTTQLDSAYAVTTSTMDGTAPSALQNIQIGADGTVSSVYKNGAVIKDYVIPLANVPSPDSLTPENGNVYMINKDSGPVLTGTPGTGGLGSIASNALEASTVDLANELPSMIATQRNYSANSQAFQSAATIAEVLVNMKL